MSNDGKYVRAPNWNRNREPEESNGACGSCHEKQENGPVSDYEQNHGDNKNHGTSEGSSNRQEPRAGADEIGEDLKEPTNRSNEGGTIMEQSTSHQENREYIQKIGQMQNTLDQLVTEMSSNQTRNAVGSARIDADHFWIDSTDVPGPSSTTGTIRWETIQPFPNDVPANQMWEQWNLFKERFEIAASLANVNDPIKRSQTLFLAMGETLQGITRSTSLRPCLQGPNCYSVFVKNIEGYLQSMIDLTAAHETFSKLEQDADEPTITFHARLMEKVRPCRYDPADQDRLVRMQLLKGMRNREVARTARIFGYDTMFIVQSATRLEAYRQ